MPNIYIATSPWVGTTKYASRVVWMVAPLKPREVVVCTQIFQNSDEGKTDCSTGSGDYYAEHTHGEDFMHRAAGKYAALHNEAVTDDAKFAPPLVARIANALFA